MLMATLPEQTLRSPFNNRPTRELYIQDQLHSGEGSQDYIPIFLRDTFDDRREPKHEHAQPENHESEGPSHVHAFERVHVK